MAAVLSCLIMCCELNRKVQRCGIVRHSIQEFLGKSCASVDVRTLPYWRPMICLMLEISVLFVICEELASRTLSNLPLHNIIS